MENLKILSLLWISYLLIVVKAEEKNGYIFTCPRSLKSGGSNQLLLRRFGTLHAGNLSVKVWDAFETTEKVFNIEEGVADSYLELYLKPAVRPLYKGKIKINGSFGDYTIKGNREDVKFDFAMNSIVLLQTDKPIYKEGQTVKFRVLRLNNELKPVIEGNADIWVEDPQGTRLFQWKNVSLGRGMRQFDFPLADEPVKGNWKISASFADEVTTTTFEVKEYVTPKFDVKIQIPTFVLSDAEEIPISVCAKYTYGKPVKGNLSISIYTMGTRRFDAEIPPQQYNGEINGCFEYKINVSLVESDLLNPIRIYPQNPGIKIVANVEEFGTGVKRKETRDIQKSRNPLTLAFDKELGVFYKPGLPYNGKLFVKHPDNTPAVDEDIEVCYLLTGKIIGMYRKRQDSKNVKYCRNYTSNDEGVIEFSIPRQIQDSTTIDIMATSLKYERTRSLRQPQTSMSLSPWFSPSGSFIQLQHIQEVIPCITTKKFKLLFTSKADAAFKFHYQVFHQGKIVRTGSIEKSFLVSDDVSNLYEYKYKIVDDVGVNIHIPADLHSSLEESEEQKERCKLAKEARRQPYVGEVDFEINIDPSLTPSFWLLTYYVRDDKETVADSQKFAVEKCYKNQVKLQFGDDVQQPGTKTSLRVTSSPNSLCGIKVIDKSVTLLNSDDQLTSDKIFTLLESFDNGMHSVVNKCNKDSPDVCQSPSTLHTYFHSFRRSSSYADSLTAFEKAGCLVISDLRLFTRPCEKLDFDFDYRLDYHYGYRRRFGPHRRKWYNRPKTVYFDDTVSARRRIIPMTDSYDLETEKETPPTKSVVDVRDYFPDTWLFELEMTDADGVYLTKKKLPHTITEWVGSAVCINGDDGLGLSNTTTIKGFQVFFISTTLPYSVIRGELFWITVSVFSYVDKPLPIKVSLDRIEGFEVTSDSIDGEICIPPGSSINLKVQLKGTALGKLNITVRAQSAQSSEVCGSDDISYAVAKDGITKSIIVEAEGWPAENIESVLFCPKDEENGVFKKIFSLIEPEDVVPDSSRDYLDVTGIVFGKGLDNLEKLVQLPTGCGEQNMVKFAPNVVAMDVLVSTGQLTDELKSRITRNLNTGVQRELQYRHPDGSFSAFGIRDKEGSMFLTAFVLRYFSEASKYISIVNSTLVQMQNWITSKQQADGCFPDIGRIIHRGLLGGITSDKSQGPITAYVLASLLISGYQNQTVLDRALSCIEDSKDTSLYAEFLYSYAEILAGKEDAAKQRINSMKSRVIRKGKVEYYHDVNAKKSQDVETSAYAVLSILKSGGNAVEALRIVEYLTQNMNPRGGFFSTQDTCVGMEALGQFSKLTFKDPIDITITVTGALEKDIRISEEDKLLVKRFKIEKIPSEVSVEARGAGCAVIQNTLRYSVKTTPGERYFNLGTVGKCLDDKCKKGSISVSVSYVPEDRKTGMALIEVKMMSGVVPVKKSLENLLNNKLLKLMRYDMENNVVVFYFNEITNDVKNFTFQVKEVIRIENSQPGTVTVYDYYNKDISSSTSYSLKNCEESGMCTKES